MRLRSIWVWLLTLLLSSLAGVLVFAILREPRPTEVDPIDLRQDRPAGMRGAEPGGGESQPGRGEPDQAGGGGADPDKDGGAGGDPSEPDGDGDDGGGASDPRDASDPDDDPGGGGDDDRQDDDGGDGD